MMGANLMTKAINIWIISYLYCQCNAHLLRGSKKLIHEAILECWGDLCKTSSDCDHGERCSEYFAGNFRCRNTKKYDSQCSEAAKNKLDSNVDTMIMNIAPNKKRMAIEKEEQDYALEIEPKQQENAEHMKRINYNPIPIDLTDVMFGIESQALETPSSSTTENSSNNQYHQNLIEPETNDHISPNANFMFLRSENLSISQENVSESEVSEDIHDNPGIKQDSGQSLPIEVPDSDVSEKKKSEKKKPKKKKKKTGF